MFQNEEKLQVLPLQEMSGGQDANFLGLEQARTGEEIQQAQEDRIQKQLDVDNFRSGASASTTKATLFDPQ